MHVSYFTLCPNGTRRMISGLCTQGGLTVLQSSTDRPAVYSQYHKHVIVHTSTSAVPHKYWRWPVHWSFHNQQAATVLTVKGRIIAATQQITLAHARYSLHFTMGRGCPSPYNCPFPRGDPGPHMDPQSHPSPCPKRHLDHVQSLLQGSQLRQTKHRQWTITNNRPHFMLSIAM